MYANKKKKKFTRSIIRSSKKCTLTANITSKRTKTFTQKSIKKAGSRSTVLVMEEDLKSTISYSRIKLENSRKTLRMYSSMSGASGIELHRFLRQNEIIMSYRESDQDKLDIEFLIRDKSVLVDQEKKRFWFIRNWKSNPVDVYRISLEIVRYLESWKNYQSSGSLCAVPVFHDFRKSTVLVPSQQRHLTRNFPDEKSKNGKFENIIHLLYGFFMKFGNYL